MGRLIIFVLPLATIEQLGSGTRLCDHGEQLMSSCDDCDRSKPAQKQTRCEAHDKKLSNCFTCKLAGVHGAGTNICDHGKWLSSSCDDCDRIKPAQKAKRCGVHDKQLRYCFTCKLAGVPGAGTALCDHGKQHSRSCRECSG